MKRRSEGRELGGINILERSKSLKVASHTVFELFGSHPVVRLYVYSIQLNSVGTVEGAVGLASRLIKRDQSLSIERSVNAWCFTEAKERWKEKSHTRKVSISRLAWCG